MLRLLAAIPDSVLYGLTVFGAILLILAMIGGLWLITKEVLSGILDSGYLRRQEAEWMKELKGTRYQELVVELEALKARLAAVESKVAQQD